MCEACGPEAVETPLVDGLKRLDPRLTVGVIPFDFQEDLATLTAKLDAWLAEAEMGLP